MVLEKVRNMQQKVGRNPPCTGSIEHGKFVGVAVHRELRILEAQCWVDSGCRNVQFHMGEDKLQDLQEWIDVATLF